MKNANTSIFVLIFVLIIMAAAFIMASNFEYKQARIAPMTLSGIIVILAGAQLAKELLSRRKLAAESGSQKVERVDGDGQRVIYLIESAWVAGYILLAWLLGFLIATPLFALAYMKGHGGRWVLSAGMAAGLLIVVYGVFIWLLDFRLNEGLIFEMLG